MICPLCKQNRCDCDCTAADFLKARVTAVEEKLSAFMADEDDMTVAEAKAAIMRRFNETEERLTRLEDNAPVAIPGVDSVVASIRTMAVMKSEDMRRVLNAVKEAVAPNTQQPKDVQMLIIRDPMGELGRFRIRPNALGLFVHQLPGKDEWEMDVWPRRPGDFNQSQRDKEHARWMAAMLSNGLSTEVIAGVENFVKIGDLQDAANKAGWGKP